MAINLKLSQVRSADAKIEPWGRSWLGWDETLTDDELWEQNRGVWVLSIAKVQAECFATLSYAGRRQIAVELAGHELVHDPRNGKSYVALVGDVLRPGDPVRDALVGQPDSPTRNPVTYYDTGHLDSMSTSQRAQRPTSTSAAFLLTNNPEKWKPGTGV